jgi:benzoyl-CoA reductase/2-hydroxyglutaryl-CoA dehydratase subunit BcrC/BadD/HgdB
MKIEEGKYYRTRGGDGGAEEMTAHEVTYDALQKRIAELQAENARLRDALRLAIEAVEFWAAYASPYFQDKHDLAGDLQKLRAAMGEKE